MKTRDFLLKQILWTFITSFFRCQLVLSTPYVLSPDSRITSGQIDISGEQQDLNTINSQVSLNLSGFHYIDPQIFVGVLTYLVYVNQISTYYWHVTGERVGSTLYDYRFSLDQNNIQIINVSIYYLIFEKGPGKRVIQGQTPYDSLKRPGETSVKVLRQFPNQPGLKKFIKAYITGFKKTKQTPSESVHLSLRIEEISGDNDNYFLVFELDDPVGTNTIDLVYWNLLEYYLLPNEIIVSDTVSIINDNVLIYMDGFDREVQTNYFSPIFSWFTQIFFAISRLESTGIKGGIESQPSGTLNQVDITIRAKFNQQIQAAGYDMLQFLYRKCLNSKYNSVTETCVSVCPDGTYLVNIRFNRKQCYACDPSCRKCSGSGASSCTGCFGSDYLYQNTCQSSRHDFTYCNSSNECLDCNLSAKDCKYCDSDFSYCLVCNPTFYKLKGVCTSTQPQNTICDSVTLECEAIVEKESIISEEAIQSTSKTFSNLSQGSVYVATALTFSSGFVSSGSPLLSQVLTTQKAFYLLLINAIPPKFLYSFISSLSDKGVLQQFSGFNTLSRFASDSSESNTIGNQFQEQQIPSDIFINAGGGIIAVSVLGAAFLLFVVLENSRLNKIGMILYEKVACGIIVETFQVSVLIFTFSILICLTNTSEVDAKQIVLIIFCSALIGFVLIGQGVLLWKDGVSDSTQSIVKKALVQKLQNECIKERLSSRMYMIAFLTIECFLFPLIIVVSHNNGVAAAFSLAFVQVMETAMTIVIRPFVHMRETVFLIIEQTIFSCIFITFAILTVLLEAVEESETSYPASVNTLSMIITILIVAAVLLTPFTKLFRISIILKDLIKARMEKAKINVAKNNEKELIKLPQRNEVIYPTNLQSITNVEILDDISSPNPESQIFGESNKLMRIQSQFRKSQNSSFSPS